jgi:antitoxin MazE
MFIRTAPDQEDLTVLVQLAKWGNSLAVRIPAAYAKEIGASENSQAELSIEDGRLVLAPMRDIPRFDLDTLVAQITDENRHEEIGTGPALGDEFA